MLLQRFYCKVENFNDVKFSKNNKKLWKFLFFIFFILGTLSDVPGIQNKAKKKLETSNGFKKKIFLVWSNFSWNFFGILHKNLHKSYKWKFPIFFALRPFLYVLVTWYKHENWIKIILEHENLQFYLFGCVFFAKNRKFTISWLLTWKCSIESCFPMNYLPTCPSNMV
jgi:uncharacterized protein with PQ loop repeat